MQAGDVCVCVCVGMENRRRNPIRLPATRGFYFMALMFTVGFLVKLNVIPFFNEDLRRWLQMLADPPQTLN